MNKTQFVEGILVLESNYQGFSVSDKENVLEFWYELFRDDSPEVYREAIKRFISTSKFNPTVAGIREQIQELTNPNARFTADDAWSEVTKAIRNYGTYRETDALESMSPITRKIVTAIGYKLLCLSEEQMADRAHFMKMFEQNKERDRKEYMLPDSLKSETLQIKNDTVKMLADGMTMK